MNGTVDSVTTDWRGDTLAAAVASGDSVLTVADTTDFDEELGGWLTIADATPIAYTAVDHDANTVTLAGTAGAAYEVGDPVVIWDPSVPAAGAKVVEYVASVVTDRGSLEAVLPHEMIPTAGVDALVGASVTLAEVDDEWLIGEVPGREPVFDASFIDPTTTVPPAALTDGLPPTTAPTVTPIGGIGSMFFRWTEVPNPDPVTYRLYVRAGQSPLTPTVLATNLSTNPSGEVGVTGWAAFTGSTTPVQSTEQVWVGTKSVKAIRGAGTSAVITRRMIHTALTPGAGVYTVSMRLFVPALITGTAQVRINGAGVAVVVNAPVTLRDGWAEATATFTWDGVGVVNVDLRDEAITAGAYMYVDGLIITPGAAHVEFFDGDTPNTTGIDYDWTGTPGASTSTMSSITLSSVHEAAAGVGLTSHGVTKMPDGTPIVGDGSVVYYAVVTAEDADGVGPSSSVVSGTPVQVTSADIAVGAIRTNLLVFNEGIGAVLTGQTITGATIQTSSVNDQGIHLDAAGLRAYGPLGGAPFFNVDPVKGLVITLGEGTFTKLTTTGAAELGGTTTVKSGGLVKLVAGAQPPNAAPTVGSTYDTVQFNNDGLWGNRRGWSTDGTYWYTLRTGTASRQFLEKWDTSGAKVAEVESLFGGGAAGGCVVLSGKVYVLLQSGPNWYVLRHTAATLAYDTVVNQWTLADGSDTPAIGTDGTDLLIAQSRPTNSDKVRVQKFTPPTTNGGLLTAGTSVDTSTGFNQNLTTVIYGSFDFGANRYVLANENGGTTFRSYDATGVNQNTEHWQSGDMPGKVGLAYTGGAFVSMDTNGLMRTYTGQDKAVAIGDASLTKWVSSTNYRMGRSVSVGITASSTAFTFSGTDLTAADVGALITGTGIQAGTTIATVGAGTGTLSLAATGPTATITATVELQTPQSPLVSFTQYKRSKLTVTTASLPASPGASDPNQVQVYVGSGATSPARTAMWRQTTPAVGVTTAIYSTLATSGNNPPAANNFPNATAAIMQASNNGFTVDANSDGSIGTGTFRTSIDARVVGTDTWHTVGGAGEPAFTNSWTNRGAAGHPPVSFRKNGTGDVRLRGHLSTTGTASNTAAFTLPAGSRPDFAIEALPLGTNTLGTIARADIATTGVVTVLYPAGVTWCSLNGVSFSTA